MFRTRALKYFFCTFDTKSCAKAVIGRGKPLAKVLENGMKKFLDRITLERKIKPPNIAIITVGNNSNSLLYVGLKIEQFKRVGIDHQLIHLDEGYEKEKLISVIDDLNKNHCVDGILLQLPLPNHLPGMEITNYIDPKKDVDCLTSTNLSNIVLNPSRINLLPCTPKAVLSIIDYHKIDVSSKNVTVVGRSQIVGLPLSYLLLRRHATVTICHSLTKNLENHLKEADVLIAAVGKRHLIKAEHIKKGAVIIDIGISPGTNEDKHSTVGDVEYFKALEKASFITPVPGGIGPLTVMMVSHNLMVLWCRKHNLDTRSIEEIVHLDALHNL